MDIMTRRFLTKRHRIALVLCLVDILSVELSYFLALWLRFDASLDAIPAPYLEVFRQVTPYVALTSAAICVAAGLYNCIWCFAGYRELLRCLIAWTCAFAVHVLAILALGHQMPLFYYVFGGLTQLVLLIGSRFSWRFLRLILARSVLTRHGTRENALLVGAGAAGRLILRDLSTSDRRNIVFKCIVDDDHDKWNCRIDDIPVIGGRDLIPIAVKSFSIQKIFVAIPTASAAERGAILRICNETGCPVKTLPGIYQFTDGEVSLASMKDVQVEDLLGRDPIIVNNDEILNHLDGRTVLVTGGGGSIGSELCRQIAAHHPGRLVIFDIYENNAYDIQQELLRHHPDLNLTVLIGSVRDSRRIEDVFERYKPELVFHAAAHKHVPLMEDSPCEAIKNNVLGTYKTAYAALTHGCRRFLLISTDKAVNPTNIMGASKRVCEMIIQTMDRVVRSGELSLLPHADSHHGLEQRDIQLPPDAPRTEFVAVRFGNVLGSNGSVIPLFKRQIAEGGPVTVTHPDIIRYFMTIPEAVSLVLQSATYARGGEIFVLDMGEPVKIDTLARNLIRLSGLKPDVDIRIEYTGLRPGEKLYEEKLMSEEGLAKTANRLIHIAHPIDLDTQVFLHQLEHLLRACVHNAPDIRELVAQMVPTYQPNHARV